MVWGRVTGLLDAMNLDDLALVDEALSIISRLLLNKDKYGWNTTDKVSTKENTPSRCEPLRDVRVVDFCCTLLKSGMTVQIFSTRNMQPAQERMESGAGCCVL